MTPVETVFEDRNFRYTQLERQGDIALYSQSQEHKASGTVRYEVVRIRVQQAHTWPNGHTTPEHEAYPGSTRWGTDGFTFFARVDATAKIASLTSSAGQQEGR